MSILSGIKKFWNKSDISDATEVFNTWYVLLSIILWLFGIIALSVFFGKKQVFWEYLGKLLVFSAAAYLIGLLIGFLFGIPKTLQNTRGSSDTNPLSDILVTNTNLEQISDWLTKIIVGLGLVNLRKIPLYSEQLRLAFVDAFPAGNPTISYCAVAICIYAAITAFITMYIYTRVNISSVFLRKSINEKQLVDSIIEDMAKKPEKVETLLAAVNKPENTQVKTTLIEQLK